MNRAVNLLTHKLSTAKKKDSNWRNIIAITINVPVNSCQKAVDSF